MNMLCSQKKRGIFGLWKRTDHSLYSYEACQVDKVIAINGRNH